MKWKCHSCEREHDGLPLDYSWDNPVLPVLTDGERSTLEMTSDTVTVSLRSDDGSLERNFFIRAVLPIPIRGTKEQFCWGVWTTLSEKNFGRFVELMDRHERLHEPPYFGWLASSLPSKLYRRETLRLKTHVHMSEPNVRPWVQLEPTDHPLAVEQREGITWMRVQAIAAHMLHPSS